LKKFTKKCIHYHLNFLIVCTQINPISAGNRDRKFRALEKSPDPGAPGEIGNINPPAPGAPAFRILTPDRGPRGRGMHNITIISEFFSKNNTQY